MATVILHEYFGANAQPVSILQTCFRPLLDLGKYKSRYGHKDMILINNYILKLKGGSTKNNYLLKGVSMNFFLALAVLYVTLVSSSYQESQQLT